MYFDVIHPPPDSLGDQRALWNNRETFHVTGGFAGGWQGTE